MAELVTTDSADVVYFYITKLIIYMFNKSRHIMGGEGCKDFQTTFTKPFAQKRHCLSVRKVTLEM